MPFAKNSTSPASLPPIDMRQGGAHTLTSKLPVAIQVIGYGDNTSYEYPGGLNLTLIAPPPPAPR